MSSADTCSPPLPLTCQKGFIKDLSWKGPYQKGPILIFLKVSPRNFTTNLWDISIGVPDPMLSVMNSGVWNWGPVMCSKAVGHQSVSSWTQPWGSELRPPKARRHLLFVEGEFYSRHTSCILFQYKDSVDLDTWFCLKYGKIFCRWRKEEFPRKHERLLRFLKLLFKSFLKV